MNQSQITVIDTEWAYAIECPATYDPHTVTLADARHDGQVRILSHADYDEAIELSRDKGATDGAADVDAALAEQGREAVLATLSPGHAGWEEAAINAGAAQHSGVHPHFEAAYYEAYAKAARERVEEIAAARYKLQYLCDGAWEYPGDPGACVFASEQDADDAGNELRDSDSGYRACAMRVVDGAGNVVTRWDAVEADGDG